jgi:AcrR family transcriptional regulator
MARESKSGPGHREDDRKPGGKRAVARDRVLESALDLFSRHGFDGVSTAEVALSAGVSQSVVLYHFDTKENLWREAMRLLFSRVDARTVFDQELYKDLDVVSRIRVALRRFVQTSARHPELGRVIVREGTAGGERLQWLTENLLLPNYGVFEELFAEGGRAGVLKRYPPGLVTLMVHSSAAMVFNLGPLAERVLGCSPFSDEMVRQQADLVVDVLLNGLLEAKP